MSTLSVPMKDLKATVASHRAKNFGVYSPVSLVHVMEAAESVVAEEGIDCFININTKTTYIVYHELKDV
jgi:hypothetical protein